jgi:uracil-DNA glycosylase
MTISQLVDKVFVCRLCDKSFGFSSRTKDDPYFKVPPIIGKPDDAELLFVGINPRITESNRADHKLWMRHKSNFCDLSSNKFRGNPYIEREHRYRSRVKLVKMLFGENCQFENIAAVTEIFLCATKDSGGLPDPKSPCADLFLENVVQLTKPKIIVAVGQRVMRYFVILANKKYIRDQLALRFENRDVPVVEMRDPRSLTLAELIKNNGLAETETHIRRLLGLPVKPN